jgi:hypothetical protein
MKVRLFPIFLHTDVEKLIRDTEAENSNVKIRTWSFGIDEFFDK